MHVLWCVLEQTVASVMVFDVIQGEGLKASPAQRQDEGVSGLQEPTVPAVLLQTHLKPTNNNKMKSEPLSV